MYQTHYSLWVKTIFIPYIKFVLRFTKIGNESNKIIKPGDLLRQVRRGEEN